MYNLGFNMMYSLNIMINPDELIVTNPVTQHTPAPSTTPDSGPFVVQPLVMTPPAGGRAILVNLFDSPDRGSEISVARTAATGTDVSAITSFGGFEHHNGVLSRPHQPDLNTTLPDVSTLSTSSTTRDSTDATRIPISPIRPRNPMASVPAAVIANPSTLPPLSPAPAASLARRRSEFTGINQLSSQALPVEQETSASITFNQRTPIITPENADMFRSPFGIPRVVQISPLHSPTPSPFGAQASPRVSATAVSPNNTASYSSPWGTSPSARTAPGSTRNYRRGSTFTPLISNPLRTCPLPIVEGRSPRHTISPGPCGAGVSPIAGTRSLFNSSPNFGLSRSSSTLLGQPSNVPGATRATGSVAPQTILVDPSHHSHHSLTYSPRVLPGGESQPRILVPAGVSLFGSRSFNDIRRSTASPGQHSGLESVPLVLSPVSDAAHVQFNASPATLRQLDALRRASRSASPVAVQVERVCSEASRSASFCTVTSTSSVRAITESQVLATPTTSAAIAPSTPITLSFSSSTNRISAIATSTAALPSPSNLRPH